MAKIIIAGDAVVIRSAVKLEDIKTIEKYRPNELVLRGGDDGKTPIFAVGTTTAGSGSISAYGISFDSESRDEEKLACITTSAEEADGDIKVWAADEFGAVIMNLNKLEVKLPEVLDEIASERAEVLGNITVVG